MALYHVQGMFVFLHFIPLMSQEGVGTFPLFIRSLPSLSTIRVGDKEAEPSGF